jgi:type IV pilus assembly protein PilO
MASKASAGGGVLSRLSLAAKFVFGLVLAAAVALLYFIVFFAEVDGQIAQAQSEEANLRSELARAEDAKAVYQKDVEEKTRKQQLAREQRKILPDEAEVPAFLASVQGIATISGISLASYKPEDEVPGEFFARVPMSLRLTGRFHQVARFFHGVSQLDRVTNIEEIEMKLVASSKKGGDVLLEVQCLATAFRAMGQGGEPTGRRRGAK